VRPEAARQLFTVDVDAGDARVVAAHAAAVCQLLSVHVSRLVGDLGMRTLFARSLALSQAAFPCLKKAAATPAENPYDLLRRCLEVESATTAVGAAVHVFETFTALLERFIGAGLVANLLHEVWPAIFESDTKETK